MKTSAQYRLLVQPHVSTCAPHLSVRMAPYIEDRVAGSWERFNEAALPQYMRDGIRTLHVRLDKLADLSQPHRVEDDKNLWFMIEALIQARHLLDDSCMRES